MTAFAARAIRRPRRPMHLIVLVASALHAPRIATSIERDAPRVTTSIERRDVLRLAVSATILPTAATAYDSLPTSVASAPDPAALAAEREKRKRALQEKAAKTNGQAKVLAEKVSASQTSAEFVETVDALSVWIVGQGAPRTCVGACQWLTAEDAAPLPEGFKTRELVASVKAAKETLPRFAYECEQTRTNNGICFSAGPQAEGAFAAFLTELKKRAPLQYETPYGPVAF